MPTTLAKTASCMSVIIVVGGEVCANVFEFHKLENGKRNKKRMEHLEHNNNNYIRMFRARAKLAM